MSKLTNVILGTAQWGLNYGISNTKGKIRRSEIDTIVNLANSNGCNMFDTADAYGDSEKILGDATQKSDKIITKVSQMQKRVEVETSPIKNDVLKSLTRLKRSNVAVVLLHDASDLLNPNSVSIFRQLEQLKEYGLADKIGVSVYSFEEAQKISRYFQVDVIQLPFNILNATARNLSILGELKSRGVEVHARSVFLQGLLLMKAYKLPIALRGFSSYLQTLNDLALEQNVTLAQYLMNYPLHDKKVDKVVLGIADISDLKEQIQKISKIDYTPAVNLQFKDLKLLDPRNW